MTDFSRPGLRLSQKCWTIVSLGVKLCPWLSSSRYSEGSLCHLNGPAVQYDCLVMNVSDATILRNCGNSSSDTASHSRGRECLVTNVTGATILRNCGNSSSDTASHSRGRECLVTNVTGATILRNCGKSSSDTAPHSRGREFDFSLFSKVHGGKHCYSQTCLGDTDSYFVGHAPKYMHIT